MDRYCVRTGLGYGGYGTVVEAADVVTGRAVAVKVLHRGFDDDDEPDPHLEQRMYQKLVNGCDPRVTLFAQVIGVGEHDGFHCIVFELCHATLFDVLNGVSELAPLPARHVLEMSFQMLCALAYLHSLGIIHCDLKPDNIAVRYPDSTVVQWLDPFTGFHDKKILVTPQICILDLGTAVDALLPFGNMGRAGTRQYRAPEVTLGLPWSYGVDSFSLGCVIAEIHLSDTLITTELANDQEQLASIDILFGPFPPAYARHIEDMSRGTFTFHGSNVAVQYPAGGDILADPEYGDVARRLEELQPISAQVHNRVLCDLIRKLTRLNPAERLSMDDAVKHHYFDALQTLQLG